MGEERIEGGPLAYGRKVQIYAARWPEDDDWERGLQYFKRYIKPILVAAAVDYEMVSCPQYGSLTRHIQKETLLTRRRALSQSLNLSPPLEEPVLNIMAGAPGQLTEEQKEQRRLEGASVIIGRHTLKEYMAGLRKGYMEGIEREEREKFVERSILGDGVFETKEEIERRRLEAEEAFKAMTASQAEVAAPPPPPPAPKFGLSFLNKPAAPISIPTSTPTSPSTLTPPPQPLPAYAQSPPFPLPAQPPLLLVPWTNHLGFTQIPQMLLDLFTERFKYASGGESALKLVLAPTRELTPNDLNWGIEEEGWYKNKFNETLTKITKARESYYTDLKTRLQAVRDITSGVRDRTEEEAKKPITELDLRDERLKREVRWRNEEEGYEFVKKDKKVDWDERWEGWLQVYGELPVRSQEGTFGEGS